MDELSLKCMAVADYIIDEINEYNQDKNFRNKVLLSAGRLQRLLYFCEVEYMLKNKGTPLFEDEFYAWPSGPVIGKIFLTYIQEQNGNMIPYHLPDAPKLKNDVKSIIDKILEITKDLGTTELMKMSKVEGGPHSKVFSKEDRNHGQVISKAETYIYYQKYKSILQLFGGETLIDDSEQPKQEKTWDDILYTEEDIHQFMQMPEAPAAFNPETIFGSNDSVKKQSGPRLVKRRIPPKK